MVAMCDCFFVCVKNNVCVKNKTKEQVSENQRKQSLRVNRPNDNFNHEIELTSTQFGRHVCIPMCTNTTAFVHAAS